MVKFKVFLAAALTATALVSAPNLMANIFGDMSAFLCLLSFFLKTTNRLCRLGYQCVLSGKPAGREVKRFSCSHRLEPFFGSTARALRLKAQAVGEV